MKLLRNFFFHGAGESISADRTTADDPMIGAAFQISDYFDPDANLRLAAVYDGFSMLNASTNVWRDSIRTPFDFSADEELSLR